MNIRNKAIYLFVISSAITLVTAYLFPFGDHFLKKVRSHSYVYGYSKSDYLTAQDNAKLPPAQGVPILMYHGVVIDYEELGDNTERENFIAQMEMLKYEGYETVTVEEYDLFREGKFILPPKPIIITFDDGRKDSFYTVDGILKELGFKATIFLATIKANNNNDQFYLNWDELKKVQANRRWEIGVHGRRSHEDILINENGDYSTFLTSLIYSPGQGLESVDDFEKRVEQDYIDGIEDIRKNLGIESKYFAVPLNHYGKLDSSNFDGAVDYNLAMTHRYFRLAFVEVTSNDRMALESFYNYADTDPYQARRLEVKNRSAEDLRRSLVRFAPQASSVTMLSPAESRSVVGKSVLLYGSANFGANGITLMNSPKHPSARLLFGDWGWKNYRLEADVIIEKGHSASILVYYADEENYLSLNWGNKNLFLTEYQEGKKQEIFSFYPMDFEGESNIQISVRDAAIDVSFNGKDVVKGAPINLTRGAAGLGVWDPEKAQATVKKLEIKNL